MGLGNFYFDIGTCLFFGICDLEFHEKSDIVHRIRTS